MNKRLIGAALGAAIVLGTCQALGGDAERDLVLQPVDAWSAVTDLLANGYRNVSLAEHWWATVSRVLISLAVGTAAGVAVGAATSRNEITAGAGPLVSFLKFTPPAVLVPIVIAWFGIGSSTLVSGLVAATWIVAVGAHGSLRGQSVAGGLQLVSVQRELVGSVRTALLVVWLLIPSTELVATDRGLGALVFVARNFFNGHVMTATLIIAGITGATLDRLLRLAADRFVKDPDAQEAL